MTTRRNFLTRSSLGLVAASLASRPLIGAHHELTGAPPADADTWFDISLAQWSLNKAFW